MFPLGKQNRSWGWLTAIALVVGPIASMTPLAAHQTEISGEVGGTIHLEPNDTPRAGSPSLTWFALTRRGGQPISLAQCSCSLAVYAQPRQPGAAPLLQPTLSSTNAEGRQGIPSTTITFPRAGAYELVLQGRPVTAGSFAPFELKFSVTVAQ